MYYKIISGQDIFELNPGLRAIEKYNKLTSMQMTYVCLIMDNSKDNPIRTLEGKNKREKAAKLAGYSFEADGKRLNKNARDMVDGKVPSVNEAIDLFKELHYDEDTATYESIVAQISQIKELLIKPNKKHRELETSVRMAAKLPEMVKTKKELEQLLNLTVSQKPELDNVVTLPEVTLEETGGEPMSTLDLFMMEKMKKS